MLKNLGTVGKLKWFDKYNSERKGREYVHNVLVVMSSIPACREVYLIELLCDEVSQWLAIKGQCTLIFTDGQDIINILFIVVLNINNANLTMTPFGSGGGTGI